MKIIQIMIVLASCLLQVLIAFFPSLISSTLGLSPQPSGKELVDYQITTISLHFSLTTAAIGSILLLESFGAAAFQQEMSRLLGVVEVKKLSAEDFYSDFLHAATKAKHYVNISYLAPDPPADSDIDFKKKYYKELQTLIVKKKHITFRRIVRKTRANAPWVARLLSDLQNQPNASLALIVEADNESNPAALSVQVVDKSKVWFVAVKDHDQFEDWRDIFIENQKLADAMSIYYDRLWNRSDVLLQSGKLTTAGKTFVKEHPLPLQPSRRKGGST